MASGTERATMLDLDASHLHIAIIATRWNQQIVDRLITGAERALAAVGATHRLVTVPGAFELPFAAQSVISSGTVDALVVLGAVIRGETTHYELVSEGCAAGIMQVQLTQGTPIGMGVLTVENDAQAFARSEPAGGHNVGEEATSAAIEMALLAAGEAAQSPIHDAGSTAP
ncbi:MAG: 6,7-dimethyl-8-ribityllumazine synthase [Ilumatobacter sp.]|nr:6,7-dimethyl-8-ribityllumazine synthase [Ilumatobacter sp.]